ncbi:unnamed protein product, partial [Ectocarpus sp. 4 AP-2014]
MECDSLMDSPGYCRPRAVSVVSGDQYVCPFLFDFLTISELGRAASVCSTWRTNAADDELWRDIYERTQVGEAGMEEWAQSLAARPFEEDAVGWEVEVLSEEDVMWTPGLVVAYSGGRYLVEYADGSSRWESEYRTEGAWHRRGNSRLSFLGRLHDSLAGQDADGVAAAVSNTHPSAPPDSSRGAPAAAEKAGETRSFPDWPRLRHGRWREEVKANCCHVPAVELVKLDDHTDEVLDLKFSPDGTRLATCSRDMSILVYT